MPRPSDPVLPSIEALERALARERDRTRTLREVGLLLDSSVPRDELLARVLAAAARVTEAERATLYLTDDDGTTLRSHATEGSAPSGAIVLPLGQGIAGAAARDKRSIASPDAYGDPRFARDWDQRTGFRTRSVLATPMVTPAQRVVGVIQVLNRRGELPTFDADDVAMLEALAAQAAVAIEGARQIEATIERTRALDELRLRLERSIRERDLLLQMEQLLARTDSVEQFVDGALAGVMRACGAAAGAVAIQDDPAAPLTLRAARGPQLEPGALLGAVVARESALARVVESGAAVASEGGPIAVDASALPGPAPTSLLVVPLPGDARAIGAIELRDRAGSHEFTREDVDLLELVAANLSTGVELARARHERERNARLAAVGGTLSNVLHDIRTPMTIISGYAQLMPDIDDPAERARYAASIVRQFDHVQALIGELLAFVRGESQLLLQRVSVDGFFADAVEVLRPELATRRVIVQLDVPEPFTARFDTAKLTRMIHNLARNASEALAPRGGGTFKITVFRENTELVARFEDDGPGIPDAIQGQLFESFVTAGKPNGTGLGLAIVKKVVDEHQGTIAVDTGTWGTRFTVRLPLNGPPSASHRPLTSAGPVPAPTARSDRAKL